MESTNKMQDTSTPKRRRINTRNRGKSRFIVESSDLLLNCSPISSKNFDNETNQGVRCESPYLPCNQVEFRNDSGNNSSSSEILGQACVLDVETDKWESLAINTSNLNDICDNRMPKTLEAIEEISEDMFQSKLEQSSINCDEKQFKKDIEKSFDVINQSICKMNEGKNRTSLFETKDSFLLDISGEDCDIVNNKSRKPNEDVPFNSYYGLPIIAKGLFKSYRKIEKFYDWQEECLNLEAIKQRNNLIYALPTSGGKTLVAEVLMMREVLNRKKNALFILPFVAIVQEKIWSLSPFAVQLDFLVEEYAAGKGHIPPKKRRKKNSIYVATIEKGLALIRSLIELNRLDEIGLIVVDELHIIGEKGRGGTLETLLTTVIFTNQDIQIVGMSATIGNLDQIGKFLHAEVYQREFRPVELVEYVKLGAMLHRIVWEGGNMDVVPERELVYEYSSAALALDPDLLGGLVSEVVPEGSCLVFCPTKRNCENVASLLCKLQRREMTTHRTEERQSLQNGLRAEGASADLCRAVRYGVAYHHAGLASDERNLLEHAFRSGVISVICCTSTLAAGVNLPAKRVIIRAPLVGRELLSLAGYKQMTGRAGRAGVCETGESIVICCPRSWAQLRAVLSAGLQPASSVLRRSGGPAGGLAGLLLAGVALRLAASRTALRGLLAHTLMALTEDDGTCDIKTICDESLQELLQSGALEVVNKKCSNDTSHLKSDDGTCVVYNDSELVVSKLGKAAIKGCMDLSTAKQLLEDLEVASRGLVVMGSLHLLYLVTPHDHAGVRPDYRHYYSIYCSLDEEGVQTAKILGITEMNAIRMMTGKPIVTVPEKVLCRFYLALMLHDLWKQIPFPEVAFKYNIPRGTVQSVMSSAASFASCAQRFCAEAEALWCFAALLGELAPRLVHCAAPALQHLMELPAVKKARAMQLMRAGYKRVEDIAKASVDDLVSAVSHMSRTAANQLISAARMMLIEKVENLRAEAEDVMEELKI